MTSNNKSGDTHLKEVRRNSKLLTKQVMIQE